MIHNEKELLVAIQQKLLTELRSHNVELKESWKQDDGKKISAFSNRINGHGFLVVGIKDSGIQNENSEKWARQAEEEISQHVNKYLDPVQAVESIRAHEVDEKWIIVIQFHNPGSVVYWNKKSFKGSGTTVAEMEPHEVMELTVRLPGLKDFTAQTADWNITGTTKALVSILRTDMNSKMDLGINMFSDINEVVGKIGIQSTKACNILFGDVKYRIIMYNKDGAPEKNETRHGVYGLISPSTIFEIQQHVKKLTDSTTEPFPNKALGESLANAVAHAAYFENDGEIIVECFHDKVAISNLCMPESAYFANKWFSRAHKTYNKILVETLRLCGKVDELGRGKNLIYGESIISGKAPPIVNIEQAGRYSRWRLTLCGGPGDEKRQRVYAELIRIYSDKSLALMGCALTYWAGKTLTEVKTYLDAESVNLLSRVLASDGGPVFYSSSNDMIHQNRWVRTIIADGIASKGLDAWEKEAYFNHAAKWSIEQSNGTLTTKSVRRMIGLGQSRPEKTMLSKLFTEWIAEKKIKRIKPGVFKIVKNDEKMLTEDDFRKILE